MEHGQKNQQPVKQTKIRPGTRAYSAILGAVLFLSIFTLCMSLAVAPSNGEVAFRFLQSQSILLIGAAVMLFYQIRYWRQTHTSPNIQKAIKGLFHWFYSQLCPVRANFKPIMSPVKNAQRITARFRDSLSDFYRQHDDHAPTTQMYGNLLELHSRRLSRLELEIRSSYQAMTVKNLEDCAVYILPDGRLRHFSIQEHLKAKREILHNSKTVHAIRGNVNAVCDLVGASRDSAESPGIRFRCPGCGSVSTAAELMKGCPYCGAAFLMENLEQRVCSFSIAPSPEMDEARFHLRLNQIINRAAFVFSVMEILFGFLPMIYDVFITRRAGAHELPVAIMLTVMSVALTFFAALAFNWILTLPVRAAAHYIYKKRRQKHSLDHQVMERNQKILTRIRTVDPTFSMESFFGNIRNKIAAIHYSSKYEQADVFSTVDLREVIRQYEDVAECIWGPMELLQYHVDSTYKTAVVETWLTLLRWDGSRITSSRENLHLELKKYASESRENPFGVHVPTCGKCGAPVDLLLGNVCSYCGSTLNFMSLDWCITDYRIQDK